MQVTLVSPQSPRDYVLAKIDQVYSHQRASQENKRLQVAVKSRRQMVDAAQAFQRQLDHALSPLLQKGLGIRMVLDPKSLPKPKFVARFEFLGQEWIIIRSPGLLGGYWKFGADPQQLTRCRAAQLEMRLCYALGKYKNSVGRLMSACLPR